MIDAIVMSFALLAYVGLMFWFGRKRQALLAIFISAPAIFGFLLHLASGDPQSDYWLFKYFAELVTGQLMVGLISYLFGTLSVRASASAKGFE